MKTWNKRLLLAAGVAAVSGLAGCGRKQEAAVSPVEEPQPMIIDGFWDFPCPMICAR